MRYRLSLFFCIVAGSVACAAGGEWEQGVRALEEGLPQVALMKLQTALDRGDVDRAQVVLKLAEAHLALGRADDALVLLQKNRAGNKSEAALLRGRIFAAQGLWSQARVAFRRAGETPALKEAAAIGEAQALAELGDEDGAIKLLSVDLENASVERRLLLAERCLRNRQLGRARDLIDRIETSEPALIAQKEYLEGQLELADGNAPRAFFIAQGLLREPARLSSGLGSGCMLLLADAIEEMQGAEAAAAAIEKFINQRIDPPYLRKLFRRLDALYQRIPKPQLAALETWAREENAGPRKTLAMFTLARERARSGDFAGALSLVAKVIDGLHDSELLAQALMLRGDGQLTTGDPQAALASFEQAMPIAEAKVMSGELEMRAGLAAFRLRDYVRAATYFRAAPGHTRRFADIARFNEALCWLQQGNAGKMNRLARELYEEFPDSPWNIELELELALHSARARDEDAALKSFIDRHPEHPRTNEARLALAERNFVRGALAESRDYLRAVNASAPTDQDRARAAYQEIFALDREPDRAADAVEACRKFLQEHPASELAAEVRMKLGQIYFRLGDFANAQTEFERLAESTPDSPLAETALFLAGQSATRTMNSAAYDRALERFESVARMNGRLALRARHEQALIKRSLGNEDEAVAIWNSLLKANPDQELRCAALSGKGNALFALGRNDPDAVEQALKVFESLASESKISAAWRNQALYRQAECLERLGRRTEAITVLYDVVDKTPPDGPEYFWFYKAGFDAARLAREDENWKGAISIYSKLASIDGPRAAEARDEMRRLRLEHFIWEK
jgi:tetratricopeptide (TPR) repeat protein